MRGGASAALGCLLSQVPKSGPGAPIILIIQRWGTRLDRAGLGSLLSQVPKKGPPPHERRPVLGDPGTWGTRLGLLRMTDRLAGRREIFRRGGFYPSSASRSLAITVKSSRVVVSPLI